MNDQAIFPNQLRYLYAILAIIAVAAGTKAMVWPRWPTAKPLNQEAISKALSNEGFKVFTLEPYAAKRNAELATSETIGYSLDNGFHLRLLRGTARQRFNFQTAFLTTLHPKLELKQRKLHFKIPAYTIGIAQQKPTLQTCLVQGYVNNEGFGVTREQLTSLIDKISKTKSNGLKSFIGLRPNRDYQCILIQASTTNKMITTQDLETWRRILGVLQSALQSTSNNHSVLPSHQ
jgi:hypothetical protein